MAETQLFFSINRTGPENKWQGISSVLKGLPGISDVLLIMKNEGDHTQINISLDAEKCSIDKIESIIKNTGATIIDVNIHFSSAISGITDPYGASAVSLPLETSLSKIDGITGSSISSSGIIKVELVPGISSKDEIIKNILKCISQKRKG